MSTTNKTFPLGYTAVMLPELDLHEQIELCQRLKVTHVSLRPRNIPQDQVGKPWGNWGNHKFDLYPARLVREGKAIKKQLDDAGMTIFGTVPAINTDATDDVLKEAFEGAAIVGAGRVRVAPTGGRGYPGEGPFNYQEWLDKSVSGYRRAVDLAKPFGVKIVIETHAHLIAASPALALNICKNFSPSQLGTIFDIANFNIEGNYQPNLAVAVLADYIDHVHIGGVKRGAGNYDAHGFRQADRIMCPLTEADLYIPGWIKALHEAGRHVPLLVENYTGNIPGAVRLEESVAALRRVIASL
jgi:sugar phosphate isomerase/epimerase